MSLKVIHGDALKVLPTLEAESVDAVVTDPPYAFRFMGQHWGRALPNPAIWRVMLRVMKPGAHALVFGGPRTFHRLAVALEDAGFELRDTLMWLYGSGFPKSHDISKAIDRGAGAKREVVSEYATDAARQWAGWGSALKPAHEPILLLRKPLGARTLAANVQQYGAGGINISGCRVGTEQVKTSINPNIRGNRFASGESGGKTIETGFSTGRWPANVLHDGSTEVMDGFATLEVEAAARFFYCAKASKKERADSKHPTVKPLALTRYLCRLITPPGGVVLDPFAGSGTTAEAALLEGFRAVVVEREASYHPDIIRRVARALPERL